MGITSRCFVGLDLAAEDVAEDEEDEEEDEDEDEEDEEDDADDSGDDEVAEALVVSDRLSGVLDASLEPSPSTIGA